MKKYYLILCVYIISALGIIKAQDSCRVLVPNLQGTYIGSCKKGLAHGKGSAKGTDSYTGFFKKGIPDGSGKYTWSDGSVYEGDWLKGKRDGEGIYRSLKDGKEIVQDGIWNEDQYVGPKPLLPKVIQKMNITSVNFSRTMDGNAINIRITQSGNTQPVEDLNLVGSSGVEFNYGSITGFQNVNFPFQCKLTYKSWNPLQTVLYDRVLEFEISEPGSWEIKIEN